MNEWVQKALSQESHPMDIVQLLTRIKTLVQISRDEMSRYYDDWDINDRVYRGHKEIDESDKMAAKRKEPAKFILPITYTQVNTFVAFALSVLNQKPYFYELSGTGVEDERAAKVAQGLLEQNLEYNNFRHQKLKQFLTDLAKYGLGVIKHSWRRDTVSVEETVMQPVTGEAIPGLEPVLVPTKTRKDATKYLGNYLVCVTPFRFLPDPRLPLTRFQEGEFCASEDEYSRSQFIEFEKQGICTGVEWIPDLAQDQMVDRRHFGILNDVKPSPIMSRQKMYIINTEVQVWLNPAKTTVGGEPIDPTRDELVLYVIWYANDARITRIEELDYPHHQFTFAVAQYEEDLINFINEGMADKLGPMQDVVDWLINSRITNVRKVISNQLLVDPSGIEIQDLRDRKPIIKLKPKVQGTGNLDRWVKQLPIVDVTTGHLNDINFIKDFSQQTTGITDNLLGQVASGRRSAQEVKSVNNNAASRIMSIINAVWNSALLPNGRMMLDNLRAGVDEPTVIRVIGQINALNLLPDAVQHFMRVSPEDIVGDYDFLLFDGTLPSQRDAQAAILQQLLEVITANPQAGIVYGYDPQLLIQAILELRGIRNADQYKLTPQRLQQIAGLVQAGRQLMGAGPAQPGNQPPNHRGNQPGTDHTRVNPPLAQSIGGMSGAGPNGGAGAKQAGLPR